jgi:hypothetical protein
LFADEGFYVWSEKAAILIRKGEKAESPTGEACYLHLGIAGQSYADKETNGMEGMLAVVIERNNISGELSLRFSFEVSFGANPWDQEFRNMQWQIKEEIAKKLLAEVAAAA